MAECAILHLRRAFRQACNRSLAVREAIAKVLVDLLMEARQLSGTPHVAMIVEQHGKCRGPDDFSGAETMAEVVNAYEQEWKDVYGADHGKL